jgi:ferritin-like metal-binding protein YciE
VARSRVEGLIPGRPTSGEITGSAGRLHADAAAGRNQTCEMTLAHNLPDTANFGASAMGLFSKDIKSMDELFVHVLQDIYYAENQIVKALPDMIEKATKRELTTAFKDHLEETEKQVSRLEQAFELLGKKPKGTKCPAIDGIIDEAKEIAGEIDNKKVLDAALIAAAQAVEHYEITRYGTLIAWAEELGEDAVGKLLAITLKEEKAADKKLSGLAEKKVNLKAAG